MVISVYHGTSLFVCPFFLKFFLNDRGIFRDLVYDGIEGQNRREGGDGVGEGEIVELLLRRDEAGMRELLLHYGPLMKYIIAPILSNPQDREDCLSETVLRVWEKIGQFDGTRGSWTAWLTAVARNTALNHARHNARHDSGGAVPEHTPSLEPTPEEQVLLQERQAALNKALGQLSSEDRILFYRKYYYMQSTAQIAAELGLTQRAVEGRLYRLKKQLRRLLGGEDRG